MRWRHATHYEGTPLHLDMCLVLDKIAESLVGEITVELDWLSEHVGVLPEDRVRIDPEVWARLAGYVGRREGIRATYQTFDGRVSEYKLHPYFRPVLRVIQEGHDKGAGHFQIVCQNSPMMAASGPDRCLGTFQKYGKKSWGWWWMDMSRALPDRCAGGKIPSEGSSLKPR